MKEYDMGERGRNHISRMVKLLCAGLILIACVLKSPMAAYARYSATYRASGDIALTVKPGTYTVVLHYSEITVQTRESGQAGSTGSGTSSDATTYEFTYRAGEEILIPKVGWLYRRTGHTGAGWNTAADGSGEDLEEFTAAVDLAEAGTTLHLYAMWSANTCYVSYDANGGEGAPDPETTYYGSLHTLSGQVPTRENHIFLGWFLEKEGGEPLESIDISGDVTVYAHWKLDTVKITYMPNLLPQGYTQVQWIRGDGSSYIDTNMQLDEESQVRITYEVIDTDESASGQTAGIFGVGGDEGFGAALQAGQLQLSYGGTGDAASGTEAASGESAGDGDLSAIYTASPYLLTGDTGSSGKHELYANRHVWRIDGEEAVTFAYKSFDTDNTALIFGAAGVSGYFKGKVYGVRFMNRSGVRASFVPAVNGAGEPGLYDIKNGCFYSNAGKGEFAVGPKQQVKTEEPVRNCKIALGENPYEGYGYHMSSWNTKPDGSGDSYMPGAEIAPQADITLYAIWEEDTAAVLKSGHLWYDRAAGGDENQYTKIRIVDEIPAQVSTAADAYWNADSEDLGTIKCYKEGTVLWIAGDGSGSIRMAADPEGMFYESIEYPATGGTAEVTYAFSSVTSIEGLDLLDCAGVKTLAWLFSQPVLAASKSGEDRGTSDTEYAESIRNLLEDESTEAVICQGMTALTGLRGIEAWDVSGVKSMDGLCGGLKGLSTIPDLAQWDTSRVTSLRLAFAGCDGITELNLDSWDMQALISVQGAFYGCDSLKSLNVRSWETVQVSDASFAFAGCDDITELDLTGWDTGKAADLTAMFKGCKMLKTICVSYAWQVGTEVSGEDMFKDCAVLTGEVGTSYSAEHVGRDYAHVDKADDPGYLSLAIVKAIAAGDTLALTYGPARTVGESYDGVLIDAVYEIPTGSKSAKDIGWISPESDVTKVKIERTFRLFKPTSLAYWFSRLQTVESWEGLENIDTSEVTSMNSIFFRAGRNVSVFDIDISSWDVSKVTTFKAMFSYAGYKASKWNVGDLEDWNMSSAVDMSQMFYASGSFGTSWYAGDIGKWDVSHVTDFSQMFGYVCLNEDSWRVDLSNWDTSSVKNMSAMFDYAAINVDDWSVGDLKNWDVSNVTNMSMMFRDAGICAGRISLKGIENWDLSSLRDASYMFCGMGARVPELVLDLRGWNTSKVENMSYMFERMFSLKTIYVGDGWNTDNVTTDQYMFAESSALTGGSGTVYDSNHTGKEYARIDTADTPGYLTKAPDVISPAAENSDIQQVYIETLLMYEDSLYDSASGAFTAGASPVSGVYYDSQEDWISSEEYTSWEDDCEYIKSLLEDGS